MKQQLKSYMRRSVATLCAGLVLTQASMPLEAALTSNKPWTTIGSAGAEHLGAFTYQNGIAFLSSPSGVIRYNVVAVDGLLEKGGGLVAPHIRMTARWRDPDSPSRVTATLRRTRISDGATSNVGGVSLDSNNFPPGGFQTRNTVCVASENFDFQNFVYFVEVNMTRAQGAIAPAIEAIQIGWDDGACIGASN